MPPSSSSHPERLRYARERLLAYPSVRLATYPTPVEDLSRLRAAVNARPRLSVKRDDAIPFGFGGNKVRKIEMVAAEALAAGADTLVTMGGVQSNHARVTAAAAARLGLQCLIVANGTPPARPSGNALVNALLGAQVEYVGSREERQPAVAAAVERLRAGGRVPFAIPLGASTPLGALGLARAVAELLDQVPPPDIIIHSTSSGGTQSGLLAGCALFEAPTRVIGISADDPADEIRRVVTTTIEGIEALLDLKPGDLRQDVVVDDSFVGAGYGVPTGESSEAIALAARTEALFLDPTYTAKAMAGLIAMVRRGVLDDASTVLFWHTGGQVALFA